MANQYIVDRVRLLLVQSLEESLRVYTQNGTRVWVNEENCRELIQLLRTRSAVKIGGPFWGDYLDAVLQEEGLNSCTHEYEEVWRQVEDGG